jgi:hypothetical protein
MTRIQAPNRPLMAALIWHEFMDLAASSCVEGIVLGRHEQSAPWSPCLRFEGDSGVPCARDIYRAGLSFCSRLLLATGRHLSRHRKCFRIVGIEKRCQG